MDHTLIALALLAFGAPVVSAQQLFVVDDDGGPGVDFTTLVDAVQAPANSILVVREGAYDGFFMNRPLTIVAEPGADVRILGYTRIETLPSGSLSTLRGLRFAPESYPTSSGQAILSILDNPGRVRLEDLDLTALVPIAPGSSLSRPLGILAASSNELALVDCRVGASGGDMDGVLDPAAAALNLGQGMQVVLVHGCTLIGADGRDASPHPITGLMMDAHPGAPGIAMGAGTTLRVLDSVVRGGAGGDGAVSLQGACVAPADGGAAVRVLGLNLVNLVTSDAVLEGGVAGAPASDPNEGLVCPSTAVDGAPIAKDPTALLTHLVTPDLSVRVATDAIVREDEPLQVRFDGTPQTWIVWAVGLSSPAALAGPVPLGALVDPLLVHVVAVDGAGQATTALPPIGDFLVPGVGVVLHHQAVSIPASGAPPGTFYFGGWSTQVLADDAL